MSASAMTEREKSIRHIVLEMHYDTVSSADVHFLLSQLDVQRQQIERLRQALADYGEHGRNCVLSRSEGGQPTSDGGYEVKYAGRWYPAKPIQALPPCSCGLAAALQEAA